MELLGEEGVRVVCVVVARVLYGCVVLLPCFGLLNYILMFCFPSGG